MILNKSDLLAYISADRLANGVTASSFRTKLKNLIYPNYIWRFIYLLRHVEFFKNKRRNIFDYCFYFYYLYRFKKISLKLGFSIPPNVFGPGLAIPHYGTIIVNANCRVGKNCRIHACTNLGASGGDSRAPQIGDNVYIAPGVKIFGSIRIASNCAIGANSVVNKSFTQEGMLIAGVPAKVVKEIQIKTIIKHI